MADSPRPPAQSAFFPQRPPAVRQQDWPGWRDISAPSCTRRGFLAATGGALAELRVSGRATVFAAQLPALRGAAAGGAAAGGMMPRSSLTAVIGLCVLFICYSLGTKPRTARYYRTRTAMPTLPGPHCPARYCHARTAGPTWPARLRATRPLGSPAPPTHYVQTAGCLACTGF